MSGLNIQPKEIFKLHLSIMKKILDLAEFKLGKNSDDYKYFKKQTMDYFYKGLTDLFMNLLNAKVLDKCTCGNKLRNGYADCSKCGGSGFINKNENV
jgi:hypothetical protein